MLQLDLQDAQRNAHDHCRCKPLEQASTEVNQCLHKCSPVFLPPGYGHHTIAILCYLGRSRADSGPGFEEGEAQPGAQRHGAGG